MSTAQERAQARDLDARALASKRARELDQAQAVINSRRDDLLLRLRRAREQEVIAEQAVAELDDIRAKVQGLAYELNGPPFHLTSTELAPLVGRSRQKVDYWVAHGRGVTPQAEDRQEPGSE